MHEDIVKQKLLESGLADTAPVDGIVDVRQVRQILSLGGELRPYRWFVQDFLAHEHGTEKSQKARYDMTILDLNKDMLRETRKSKNLAIVSMGIAAISLAASIVALIITIAGLH